MNKKLFFNIIFLCVGTFIVLSMATIIGMNFTRDSRFIADKTGKSAVENTPAPQPSPVQTASDEEGGSGGGTYVYTREKDAVAKTPTPKPTLTPTPTPGLPSVKPADSATPSPGTTASPSPGSTNTPSPGKPASPSPDGGSGAENTPKPDKETPVPDETPADAVETKASAGIMVEIVNCTGRKNLAENVRKKLEGAGYVVSAGNAPSIDPVSSQIFIRKEGADTKGVQSLLNIGRVSSKPITGSKYHITVIIGDDYEG